ncbi:hypothetical protein [Hymenobacter metallicola]|uniref:DUF4148 domain-containing protein n=1 Tax=Hymenobacter metallicola TaxID=2563114 RepID=A0A4Z0QHS7_9BACT|nr:hypothetical protein [Hymenobacter metallicola]TGE29324.1 hypothetical protein E5K02_07680 [Hymenobacter metallicola]
MKTFRFLSLAALLTLGSGYLVATAAPATLAQRVLTLFEQGRADGRGYRASLDPNSPTYYDTLAAKEEQVQENADNNVSPGTAYWNGFSVGLQR